MRFSSLKSEPGEATKVRFQKIWNDKDEEKMLQDIAASIESEVQLYETTPKAPIDHIFQYQYANLTPALQEQLTYLRQFKRQEE